MTSAKLGEKWSASCSGRITQWERFRSTRCIEGWVGPRAGLDDMDPPTTPSLPAHIQSLYRMSPYHSSISKILSYHFALFFVGLGPSPLSPRTLNGLLYQPSRMDDDKVWGIHGIIGRENPLQCHFFHHKSQITWPEIETRRGGTPAINRLIYETLF